MAPSHLPLFVVFPGAEFKHKPASTKTLSRKHDSMFIPALHRPRCYTDSSRNMLPPTSNHLPQQILSAIFALLPLLGPGPTLDPLIFAIAPCGIILALIRVFHTTPSSPACTADCKIKLASPARLLPACFGILLQLTVIIYALLSHPLSHAALFTAGTIALSGGLYICALLISRSFPASKAAAAIAAVLSAGGFTAQFLGLRGLHWSVALAQFAAVAVMAGVRAYCLPATAEIVELVVRKATPPPRRASLEDLAARAGLPREIASMAVTPSVLQAHTVIAAVIAIINDHAANGRTVQAEWCVLWLMHLADRYVPAEKGGPEMSALVHPVLEEYGHNPDLYIPVGESREQQQPAITPCDDDLRTLLMIAIIANDIPLASHLVVSGTALHETDYRGRTALHYAAQLGHGGITRLLLSHDDTLVAALDKAGMTAVDLAGSGAVVSVLLFYGADDPAGRQKLQEQDGVHWAVWRGRVGSVERLVDADPANVQRCDCDGNTPLHVAASAGACGIAEILLQKGADVDALGANGETALHCAARVGHVGLVALLLAAGADMEIVCDSGRTAVQLAAQAGNDGVLGLLLERGADEAPVDGGVTLLHVGAGSGSAAVVGLLLQRSQRDVHALTDVTKETPLHMASSPQSAAVLLDHGADIAATDRTGKSALHLAASRGDTATMTLLLSRGAAKEAVSRIGETPLHLAASAGHCATVQTLLDNGANIEALNNDIETPLHLAALQGHTNVIRLLLDRGAALHAISHPRKTALHMAARSGHTECVQALLDRGSMLHAVDNTEQTALHMAAGDGHSPTVQLLLDRGASLVAVDDYRRPALHLAAADGHTSTVQLLLIRGAAVAATDQWLQTALHTAAQSGHVATMQVLLDHGASCAAVDQHTQTPLHIAARYGRAPAVTLLLTRGADLRGRGHWRETPLHMAARAGRTEVVRVLLGYGASVEDVDHWGGTPLHGSAWGGHAETARVLLGGGAVVDAVNTKRETALNAAEIYRHMGVVEVLKEWEAKRESGGE